jgi:hypothetical protein
MVEHDQKARLAQAILDNREQRRSGLPHEMFGEFAWDALLHLFIADAASQRLNGHMLAKRTFCPPSVMQRWLVFMSRNELVIGDGDGDLSDLLTLSAKALAAIEIYLARTNDMARSMFSSHAS